MRKAICKPVLHGYTAVIVEATYKRLISITSSLLEQEKQWHLPHLNIKHFMSSVDELSIVTFIFKFIAIAPNLW